MRKTRKCAFCGKEFTCNSGSQRYCSEQCAEAAKAQRIHGALPVTPLLWPLLTSHGKLYSMTLVIATNRHVRETSSDKSIVFPSYACLIYYVCSG